MSAPSVATFLICLCGQRRCALPLKNVVETMRPLAAEALAGMPAFLLGVAKIRGAAVPVVDLCSLIGTVQTSQPTRYVTIRLGERTVAAAVDSVVGLRELPVDSHSTLPPLLRDTNGDVLSSITVLDADLLIVLQSAHLVPEATWQAMETRGSVR